MKTGVLEAVAAAILLTVAAIAALPTASTRGIVANPVPWRSVPVGMELPVLPSRTALSSMPGLHSGLK